MDIIGKSESPFPAEAHYILQYGNKAAHITEMGAKRHYSSLRVQQSRFVQVNEYSLPPQAQIRPPRYVVPNRFLQIRDPSIVSNWQGRTSERKGFRLHQCRESNPAQSPSVGHRMALETLCCIK